MNMMIDEEYTDCFTKKLSIEAAKKEMLRNELFLKDFHEYRKDEGDGFDWDRWEADGWVFS